MADKPNKTDKMNLTALTAELTRLQETVRSANSEAERAEGALTEVLARLKRDFGCSSIKDAKRKLQELENDSETAKERFETALTEFKKEYQL